MYVWTARLCVSLGPQLLQAAADEGEQPRAGACHSGGWRPPRAELSTTSRYVVTLELTAFASHDTPRPRTGARCTGMDALLHSMYMHGSVQRGIGCAPSVASVSAPLHCILPRHNLTPVQWTLKRQRLPKSAHRVPFIACSAASTADQLATSFPLPSSDTRKPKVLVAGAGIGGLVRLSDTPVGH